MITVSKPLNLSKFSKAEIKNATVLNPNTTSTQAYEHIETSIKENILKRNAKRKRY